MKKLFLFLGLVCVGLGAYAQNYADELIEAGPCDPIIALFCPSGVEDAANVVDSDRSNFAVLKSNLGVNLIENTAFIEVGFSNPSPAGSTIGMELGEINENLNIDVLETFVIRVYDTDGSEVETIESISLLDLGVLSSGAGVNRLSVETSPGNYEIASLRLELTSLVSLAQEIALYSIYTEEACPGIAADAVLTQESVTDAENAVDDDPESSAVLNLPLAITNAASLQLELPEAALPGDYVGFKIGKDQQILNAGLLENLSIIAYNAQGEELERRSDFNLADLVALEPLAPILGSLLGLSGSETQSAVVGFATSSALQESIASIGIEVQPLVGLGLDFEVFGGFYYSTENALQLTASAPSIGFGDQVTITAAPGFDAYAWSTGDLGNSITVSQPGMYTVSATRFDGCPVEGTIRILDNTCSGTTNQPNRVVATGACETQVPIFCPSGVTNAENAVDGDSETFATLSATIGVSLIESQAFIRMGFDQGQAPGSVFNFKVQALNQQLNADVLDQIHVVFYGPSGSEVFRQENISVQDVQLLSGEGRVANIQVTTPIDIEPITEVQFEIEALVNVLQEVALYEVTTTCGCPVRTANEVVNTENVTDAQRIVDNDPNNFATMSPGIVSIAQQAQLEVAFDNPAIEGDFVAFQVALENNVLAAGVIDNVEVELLNASGEVVASNTEFTLAELVAAEQLAGTLGSLLGLSSGGLTPYLIGMEVPEGLEVTGIRLTLNPVIGVLQSIRVFNAIHNPRIQNVELTTSAATLCASDEVTISAPAGFDAYLWSTGETTREIMVSEPGLYTCSITGANACDFTGAVFVSAESLVFDVAETQPSCNQATGILSVVIDGSPDDFTYEWSTGATTPSIVNIPAGIYSVTVTENSTGCTGTEEIFLSDAQAPEVPVWIRHASCGNQDGAIYLNLPEDATVQWSTGDNTPIIKRLAAGTYTAEITFADGCKRFAQYIVIDRSNFGLSAEVTPSSCTAATGTIDITVSQPGTYRYEWSNGATSEDLVGLAPGFYDLIVTNILTGCQDIINLAVSSQGAPVITANVIQEERCARERNGIIEIGVDAANTVDILWNTGETTLRIENLGPALYKVTVSDSFGCEANAIFPLVARDSLRGSVTAEESLACEAPFDGSASAAITGGRMPYNYAWSNGENTADIFGLAPGTYNLTVTDANGCPLSLTTNVVLDENCDDNGNGGGGNGGDDDDIDEDEADINNIFTPNGDGANDTWVLGINHNNFDRVAVRVVNIYGAWVFESSDYDDSWAGNFRDSNDPLPDGTYYYDLTLVKGSEEKELKSYVIIKR